VSVGTMLENNRSAHIGVYLVHAVSCNWRTSETYFPTIPRKKLEVSLEWLRKTEIWLRNKGISCWTATFGEIVLSAFMVTSIHGRDVTLCILFLEFWVLVARAGLWHFGGLYRLHVQGWRIVEAGYNASSLALLFDSGHVSGAIRRNVWFCPNYTAMQHTGP
jgi:hypothetical protein